MDLLHGSTDPFLSGLDSDEQHPRVLGMNGLVLRNTPKESAVDQQQMEESCHEEHEEESDEEPTVEPNRAPEVMPEADAPPTVGVLEGFPNSREWWDKEDCAEAIALAQHVIDDDSISLENVRLRNGTGFWLRAMARFPQLRLLNLLRFSGAFSKKNGKPFVLQIPGGQHDMWLQQFEWNAEALTGRHTRLSLVQRDLPLYTHVFICCDKKKDPGYVAVVKGL